MNVIFKYLTAIVIVAIALSNSTDPPNGRTGAPGDGRCSDCHQGNNFDGNVRIGGLPAEVVSGDTYTLSVSVNNTDGNAVRAGFQMVSLFNGDFTNAGELNADSSDEGIAVGGTRRYIEHRGAKNFQDSVAQWIFQWEAPIVDDAKEIVMFATGNIANGSGSSGDAVKFTDALTTVRPASADTLKVSIDIVDIVCNGEQGNLNAIPVGGQEPYEFLWSNGTTTAANNGVLAGFYSVTVTDSNDSTAVAEVILDQPEEFIFDFVVMNETSVGSSDGSITTSVTGGTAPYSYSWSNNSNLQNITDLTSGEYLLVVTDANGCMDTAAVVITVISCSFEVNLSVNQITCAGENDGEAFIDPSGFEQPLTFQWSNGDNSFIAIAGLEPGDYDITVTDGSGCSLTEAFTIVDPDPLTLSTEVIIEDCENPGLNAITAQATGGSGTYSYLWSNGSTTETISNLAEGVYIVTVTDDNGCNLVSEEQFISFEDNEAPVVTFTDNVDLYVDAMGELDLAPLEISATDNCGIQTEELSGDLSCTTLGSRTLTFEATDLNGNVTIREILVNSIIDTIPPTAACLDDITQEGCDTVFYDMPEFFDNCSVASVELAEGLPSGSIFPKDSTRVTYNAFDEAGNFFCCSFWVVTTNDLEITVDEVTDATPGEGGSISISVTGGSGDYTYEWIFNDTLIVSNFEDITNLMPGAYTVNISDASGCLIVSDAILVEMGSSAFDQAITEVKLYPNPVGEILFLEYHEAPTNISLFNSNGQQLAIPMVDSNGGLIKIRVDDLNDGVYFLKVEFENESRSMRFLKI